MATVRIPLSEQEEAHVALIVEVHRTALAKAEELNAKRWGPITRAHQVPDGVEVRVLARVGDGPAFLVFEAPDIAPGTDAGGSSEESVKSTDANSVIGA